MINAAVLSSNSNNRRRSIIIIINYIARPDLTRNAFILFYQCAREHNFPNRARRKEKRINNNNIIICTLNYVLLCNYVIL